MIGMHRTLQQEFIKKIQVLRRPSPQILICKLGVCVAKSASEFVGFF